MPDFFCSKKNDTANVLGESFPMKKTPGVLMNEP